MIQRKTPVKSHTFG